MSMRGTTVDYGALVNPRPSYDYEELIEHLLESLPPLWQKTYRKMAQSPTSIHQFSQNGFEFLFDRASELHARGIVSGERAVEDRIVVAYGRSTAMARHNGNGTKRNLLGSAAERFGDKTERSYLPGKFLGGELDISLYPQYRNLDHERSADSRVYRAMKKYCSEHPGTFCFTRLIYTSRFWCPAAIEHGLLRADSTFWVRKFKNAPVESRIPLFLRNGRKSTPELSSAS